MARFDGRDGTGLANVFENEANGELVCSCGEFRATGRVVCGHIVKVYEGGLDVKTPSGVRPLSDSGVIEVVLVGDPPAKATVHVLGPDDQGDLEAHLFLGRDAGPRFLGFIRATEGRQVVRRMVFDYLRGRFLDGVDCRSPHHYTPKWRSRADAAREDDPTSPKNIADTLSIVANGVCVDCADAAIPDVEPDRGRPAAGGRPRGQRS